MADANVISHTLKLCSYNIAGFNQCNWSYVQQLVDSHDFVLLQELWLHSTEGHKISDSLHNVNMHFVSGMPDDALVAGRPYGGCCILWNSGINCRIQPVLSDSRRLCCIKADVGGCPILIVNVYMPCDTETDRDNLNDFNAILNDIANLRELYDVTQVIIGGDFNTCFSRPSSLHTASLSRFIVDENLSMLSSLPFYYVDYTYESAAHGTKSTLDHLFVSEQLLHSVADVHVDHCALNGSDHSVLHLGLNLRVSVIPKPSNQRRTPKPVWHKADDRHIECYQDYIDRLSLAVPLPIEALHCRSPQCVTHDVVLRQLYKSLVNMCIAAGRECIPHSSPSMTTDRRPLPLWSTHVKPLKEDAMFWHAVWKSCGSPPTGEVALVRRFTRAKYHRAIRTIKKNDEYARSRKMAEHFLEQDRRDFWAEVKRMRGRKTAASATVDGEFEDEEIAEVFSSKYRALYNSVPIDPDKMRALVDQIELDARHHNNDTCTSHQITFGELHTCIREMKLGKHDGHLGLYTDHLRWAPHRFLCNLLLVLNAMLAHGIIPEEMCLSTVSPIPKNAKKSLQDSENYRAIALSSVIAKALDKVLLHKVPALSSTSDLQFGFKKRHSTMQCTFVVREVIEYYTSRETDVFITLLDASKAFDRVEFTALFRILLGKGICPLVVRFLMRLYTQQSIRVRWGSAVTASFKAANGVKQGGVLSPLLFTLYVDPLLKRLKDSRVGCRIGSTFCGCLGYADDVILLTPTLNSLRTQLNICSEYAAEYSMAFNAAKTKLIRIKARNSLQPTEAPVHFMGGTIECVTSGTHLGSPIGNVDLDDVMDMAVKDFNQRVGMLRCHFKWLAPDMMYSLFKSFCMPLYGCVLWDFSHQSVEKFFIAWRKAVRALFGLHPRTHRALLPAICNDDEVSVQLLTRCGRFIRALTSSPNTIVRACAAIVADSSRSAAGHTVSRLCVQGHCSRQLIMDRSQAPPRLHREDAVESRTAAEGGVVRELLCMRHENHVNVCVQTNSFFFSLNEIDFIITSICLH